MEIGDLRRARAGPDINSWLHEFPGADQNLMTILKDPTMVDARTNGSLILTLDDPDLFRHPIAMMGEPGFWIMTDQEAERLREYLLKGGFVIGGLLADGGDGFFPIDSSNDTFKLGVNYMLTH